MPSLNRPKKSYCVKCGQPKVSTVALCACGCSYSTQQEPPYLQFKNALTAVLRKLGLIGPVTPAGDKLIEIAKAFAANRRKIADDLGRTVDFDSLLSPSPPDEDLPF